MDANSRARCPTTAAVPPAGNTARTATRSASRTRNRTRAACARAARAPADPTSGDAGPAARRRTTARAGPRSRNGRVVSSVISRFRMMRADRGERAEGLDEVAERAEPDDENAAQPEQLAIDRERRFLHRLPSCSACTDGLTRPSPIACNASSAARPACGRAPPPARPRRPAAPASRSRRARRSRPGRRDRSRSPAAPSPAPRSPPGRTPRARWRRAPRRRPASARPACRRTRRRCAAARRRRAVSAMAASSAA